MCIRIYFESYLICYRLRVDGVYVYYVSLNYGCMS